MNKKKVLSSAISIALASVMCVGLAACGESENSESPSKFAQSFVSEKIDEATWNEFFNEKDEKGVCGLKSFNNVKVQFEVKWAYETETYKAVREMTATYTYADCKEHVKAICKDTVEGEVPDEDTEFIQAGEKEYEYYILYTNADQREAWYPDTTFRVVQQENGKKVVKDVDVELEDYFGVGSAIWEFSSLYAILTLVEYGADYSKLEYSEEVKGYKGYDGDVEEGDGYLSFIYKFQDKKLKTYYLEIHEGAPQEFYFLFTYGGQSVTVPNVTK